MNRATGVQLFFRAMRGRIFVRLVGSNREKSWLIYDTLLPLLGVIAFVYVYKAIGAPELYIKYVVMGGAAMAFWMNVMWGMAAQFYWDKQMGNMEIYMMLPCGLTPILLGMSFGGFISTLLRAVSIVFLGSLIFDIRFSVPDWPMFLLIFSLGMIAIYGLGTAMASAFLYFGREAWHTVSLLTEPVFFLSGLYFPVQILGFGVGMVASLIPLTLSLDALRQALFPSSHPGFLPIWSELGIVAGLAVIFIVLSRVSLRRMEFLARREGRLSLRF